LGLVPAYRVYPVGESGHYIGRLEIDCPDDETALGRAKEIADGHAVELWEGKRFIARLDGQSASAAETPK
jgi:hypothetical protein